MPVRKIGSVAVDLALETPIDEGLPPAMLIPEFDPEVLATHRDLLTPFCYNETSGGLKLSIHP